MRGHEGARMAGHEPGGFLTLLRRRGGGSSGVRGKVGGLGTALKPGFALLLG